LAILTEIFFLNTDPTQLLSETRKSFFCNLWWR